MIMATLVGLGYIFRALVHYPHGGEYGGMQADMVLAVSWSEGNSKWTVSMGSILSIVNLKTHPHSDYISRTE